MNRLSVQERAKILGLLVEGNSLRATTRITGFSINTISKLLVDVGNRALNFMMKMLWVCEYVVCSAMKIWCFVGAKAKNVTPERKAEGWGEVWTWVGIHADTKLCVSYLVGGRDAAWASDFMEDCAMRINSRVQVTTDGHKAYLEAVEGAFGMDVDYAQPQKIFGAPTDAEQRRYSPAKCIGTDMKVVSGNPDPAHVSTSFVERQNLTMRMSMRRFTRLTNGFSKKVENHAAMVALHLMHYNFARAHKTLRVTPAMEAGLSDHVWSLEEIALLAN